MAARTSSASGRPPFTVLPLIHRADEAAGVLAEWSGLSDREVEWVRSARAGSDEDGYSEALLGVDGEGW